jgi:hypothetical protein
MGSLTAVPALAEAGNPVRPKPLYSRLGFSAWRSGGSLEFHVDNRRLSGEAGIAEVLQRKPAFLMLLNAAVFLLLTLSSMANALPAFNVVQYGAAGDGHTLDSPAIQRAIDAASVHGGTVIVPAGTYLSGSIFVKSGVTLEIQSGATILGSQRIADYPMMPTRIAGIEMSWPAALVNGYSHDVAIDNITIRNNEDGHGPSTDGIDIDSSRNILVSHADIAVNDDALCLKAGRDSDGLRVARPTEDVVIRD